MVDEREREEAARARRVQDYADSMDESAGRRKGRIHRFVSDTTSPAALERRRSDERSLIDAFTYSERSAQLRLVLDDLDRRSLVALNAAERRAQEARAHLERIQQNATRDRHGLRVYKTADGLQAFFEDGTALTAAEMADVPWKKGAPTWEQRRDAGVANDTADREVREIVEYRKRLEEHRERLDSDPTPAELDLMEQELADLPPALQGRFESSTRQSAARTHAPDNTFASAPQVCTAFASATGAQSPAPVASDRAPPTPPRDPARPS